MKIHKKDKKSFLNSVNEKRFFYRKNLQKNVKE
jgi:hypothetical protein